MENTFKEVTVFFPLHYELLRLLAKISFLLITVSLPAFRSSVGSVAYQYLLKMRSRGFLDV